MIKTLSASITSYTLQNLKIWTKYVIKITINNGDYAGPWSTEHEARTKQDGLLPVHLSVLLYFLIYSVTFFK